MDTLSSIDTGMTRMHAFDWETASLAEAKVNREDATLRVRPAGCAGHCLMRQDGPSRQQDLRSEAPVRC